MEGGVKVSYMIPTYVQVFYTLFLVRGGRPQNPYNTIAVNSIKILYLSSRNDDGAVPVKCDISSMLDTFQSSDDVRFTTLSNMSLT